MFLFQLFQVGARAQLWYRHHEAMDPSCQKTGGDDGGCSMCVYIECAGFAVLPKHAVD